MITEYYQAPKNQATPFHAEIHFIDRDSIRTMLKNHFADYFSHYIEDLHEYSQDILHESQLRASTAFEAFQALFASHEEFDDEGKATSFLSGAENAEDEKSDRSAFYVDYIVTHQLRHRP